MARGGKLKYKEPFSDYISFPIEEEHFFSDLFGKQSTHGLADSVSKETWKAYRTKLVTHLQRYIEANVPFSDNSHRREAEFAFGRLQAALRSQQDHLVVIGLIRICMVLMGGRPNHWHLRRVNNQKHFVLDRYRSVSITQSPKQKARLILDKFAFASARNKEMTESFDLEVKPPFAPQKIIEWLRENYPEDYLEMFA